MIDPRALMASLQPGGAAQGGGTPLDALTGPQPPMPTFPSPGAMPGAATPPPQGGGPDWSRIMQAVMPLVMATVAGRMGGRAGAGAALQGYTQNQLQQQALEQRRMEAETDNARQDAAMAWSQQFRLQEFTAQRAQQAATFVQSTLKNLSEMTDPAQQATALSLAKRYGQELYGLDPAAFDVVIPPNAGRLAQQAQQTLDKLKQLHGDKFADLVASGASVEVNGTPTKLTDLLSQAGLAVTDQMGAVVNPVAKVVPPPNLTEFETFLQDVLTDEAAKLGKPVEQLTAAERRKMTVQARKEYGQADDRPPAAPMPTASGLPPRLENQVNGIARAFGIEPVVKKVQTQAEAVNFVSSLDPTSQNPADDQALIYAFAKAMDPDSVVREGEYATVQKYAQSWLENFKFNAQRVVSNQEFLSPQARANMVKTITAKYAAGRTQYDNLAKEYARRINKVTGRADGADYLTDYAGSFPDVAAKPSNLVQTPPPDQSGTWKWTGTVWVKR